MSTLPPYGSPQWQILTNGLEGGEGGSFPEAPADGQLYSRRGSTTSWVVSPSGGGGSVAWVDITGKPATFPPTLPIAQSGVTNLVADLDARVMVAGDVMTGDLTVRKATPILVVDKQAATENAFIAGKHTDRFRWTVVLGDATAESGGNAGADFVIYRYPDSGAPFIDRPLTIARATGVAAFLQSPTAPTLTAGTSTTQLATTAFVTTGLALKQDTSAKGAAGGYASLDGGGKVPAAQLPAYVDDVLEYANLAAFPATGVTGVLYLALDTNKIYRWTGTVYVEVSPSAGGASPSDVLPVMDGAAAAGVSALYSRGDHRHPVDTSREASITAGTTAQYWRGDKSWVAFPATMPPSAHVHPQSDITNLVADLALKAPLASPSLTGTPLAPTAAPGTNTTQIASTAYVVAAMSAAGAVSPSNALPLMNGAAAAGTSALYTREGHVHPTDTTRVAKAGDVMSGDLSIAKANPQFMLRKTAVAQHNYITGCLNSVDRWSISLGNAATESGSNAGSDFAINRYNDAGTYIDSPLIVYRGNGQVSVTGIMNVGANYILPGISWMPGSFVAKVVTLGKGGSFGHNATLDAGGTIWRAIEAGYVGALYQDSGTGNWVLMSTAASVAAGGSASFGTVLTVDKGGNVASSGNLYAGSGIVSGTAANIVLGNSSGAGAVYLRPNGIASATGQAYLDSSGTLTVAGALQCSGNFTATGANCILATSGNAAGYIYLRPQNYLSALGQAYLDPNGSFIIVGAGYKPGGGVWADSSDARIKTVEAEYKQGLAAVLKLRPVVYRFKGNDTPEALSDSKGVAPYDDSPHAQVDRPFIGLVAQEVEIPMPEMITRRAGFIDGQPVDDLRILDVSALTYALVNSVKELHDRLVALEPSPTKRKK